MTHTCCYRFGHNPEKCICSRDAYRRQLFSSYINIVREIDNVDGTDRVAKIEQAGERGRLTSWISDLFVSDDTTLQDATYGWLNMNRIEIQTLAKLLAEDKTVHKYLTSYGGKDFADAVTVFLDETEGLGEMLSCEHLRNLTELVLDF